MQEQYQVIDFADWPRKQQFEFYQNFSQPYFSVGCDIEAQQLWQYCREQQMSFFAATMYLMLKAANQLAPFRYRLVDGEVRLYDDIAVSAVMLAKDNNMRFTHIPYYADFAEFNSSMMQVKEKALSQPFFSANFAKEMQAIATIHSSTLPWIKLKSFNHATNLAEGNYGIPKIVFGQYDETLGHLPVVIDVHHALMDGFHVAQYVEVLQQMFKRPESTFRS